MTKIRMRDTTAHAEHGVLLAGEVYDLPDDVAAHLKNGRLAGTAHADTETYHERMAREAGEAQTAPPEDEEEAAPANPQIEQQVREAGTRPGDVENATFGTREPLNPPQNQPRRSTRG